MLSNNRDWFMYSSYWGTWNRVLLRMGGDYSNQTEISLQTHNDYDSEWRDLLQCRIRQHCTVPTPRDTFTHNVPDRVYETLVEKYDRETADFFVHADLYKMIDWLQFREVEQDWVGGGGIPIALVIKSQSWLPEKMRDYWEDNRAKICECFYIERDKRMQNKMKQLVEKFNTNDAGSFGEFMNYITTADNVWNPEKYLGSRTVNGRSFGKESAFNYKYVLGNAFAEGYIDNFQFRLFKNHSNFQLYMKTRDGGWPENCTYSVTVDKKNDLIAFIADKLSK